MRTALHKGPDDYAFDGPWRKTSLPVHIPAGRTVFFRANLSVPAASDLETTFLSFGHQDLEGQLFINNKPYAGVDANHKRVPLPSRGSLKLLLEFLSVPLLFCKPELAGEEGRFTGGQLVRVDHAIEAYCYDIEYAFETVEVCPDERRRILLEQAIEASLLAVDLTLPADRLKDEIRSAQRIFTTHLKAINPDPEAGRLYAVGHAHIDTAWLWPIRETIRKCGRTFSTACRMMERHKHYNFACSQPQLYTYTKKHFPDVYKQIKKWVQSGRWGTDGAMWVEPDCNITSGESLIRQMLYGLDFFKREFGTRTSVCWLPDVFGYNAALPQILKGCGVDYFYTYKLHWQARNFFPHSLFRWRGLDGTEVLAHIPRAVFGYNGQPDPHQLTKCWEWHQQKAEYPEALFPYGYGDGGGGANDEFLNKLARAQTAFPGIPHVRTGTVNRFFEDIVKTDPELPVWDGELYLETHRGTLSTQGKMKRANRTSELLLRDAEIFASLATLSGKRVNTKPLREAWETTCLHQFHDILPGSSIGMVYDEALEDHCEVQEAASEVLDQALQALAPNRRSQPTSLYVGNSLSWARDDVFAAEVPSKSIKSLVDADGTAHPVQVIGHSGKRSTILCDGATIPAMGYSVFGLSNKPAADASELKVTTNRIETPLYRLRLNKDGAITSLFDKTCKREIVEKGSVANDLQLFQDGPETEDAWNVHATFEKRRYPIEGKTTLKVVENGPVRGILRVTRKHRRTTIEQDIVVYAHTPRIDFVTCIDWKERQTMLKAAFPVAVRSTRATCEIQFGAVERPTHDNTEWDEEKFEVAGHRWVDLSETGYGVSLLNDCKYGHDIKDNVLRITLLRSTTWPDPNADEGSHEFIYSLYPHKGNWTEAETVRRAWELNVQACSMAPVAEAPSAHSFVELEGPAVIETLKPAENGKGHILRLYEPLGARGKVTVTLNTKPAKVNSCNLVEEDEDTVALRKDRFSFSMNPFQIRTFRLQ